MYDKLIVADKDIQITSNDTHVSSTTRIDITATLTDIDTYDIKNKTIYFYTADEMPENQNGKPYVSMNGEVICDEYLPENNPVNPESSFGWFIYMILGRGFDLMDEMTNAFLNDMDVISANPKILDTFYGVNLGLPRPKITENETERLLTDKEYAAYLYLRNSRLMTRLDLMSVFGHCMGDDTAEDTYHGVTVTDEINAQWHAVDHLHYNSPDDDPSSNIGRNAASDKNVIVDHDSTETGIYTIPGRTAYTGEYVTYVNIPAAGWSSAFLSFLTDFISIKGNVLIREVVR